MVRIEAEALEHHETERIFVAARLGEAQQVEDVLTQAGVDYHVKVEPFVAGIFSTFRPRNGAVFYVASRRRACPGASPCRSPDTRRSPCISVTISLMRRILLMGLDV
jgi:hypothetical protein